MDELTLFKDVHKGNVTQADKGIRWELGEIVLIFYLDKVEDYCSVFLKGKKRERELTHLHLSREETIDLIKLVDDPSKKIAVVKTFFYADFAVVDKSVQKPFIHYSI
jgi:hypothetical protein